MHDSRHCRLDHVGQALPEISGESILVDDQHEHDDERDDHEAHDGYPTTEDVRAWRAYNRRLRTDRRQRAPGGNQLELGSYAAFFSAMGVTASTAHSAVFA